MISAMKPLKHYILLIVYPDRSLNLCRKQLSVLPICAEILIDRPRGLPSLCDCPHY